MLTSFPCCVSSCNSFSPTDNKFATCSDDGTVRIWDFLRCHEERILRGMCTKSTDGVISRGEKPFFLTRGSQYRRISLSAVFVLNAPNKFLFGCCCRRFIIFRKATVHNGIALFAVHLNSKQCRWVEEHFAAPNLVETTVSGSGIHLSFSKA